MHALLGILKFLGIAIVAGAAFYGLAWFAKSRNGGVWFWQDSPPPK